MAAVPLSVYLMNINALIKFINKLTSRIYLTGRHNQTKASQAERTAAIAPGWHL